MKNQNQHIIIANKEIYARSYFLRKEYKELIFEVQQTGGNIWAEFIVELFPKENNDFSIELTDSAATEHNYLGESYSKGITDGIMKFKAQLNNQVIGISGMHFKITNLSYHAVDSKPAGYTYPLIALLNRLTNTDLFGMQINSKTMSSNVHDSKIVEYDMNNEQYILKESHFQLASPKRFANTLILSKRIETRIKCIEEGLDRWKITISPKIEYGKKLYSIDCEFRDKFEIIRKYKTTSFSIDIYKQLEQILSEFRRRKINIAGFYLLLEPLYNWEQEPFVKSNFEQVKWIVFNSLLDENITINKNENL